MAKNKPSNYISFKEARAIIKHNVKQMKHYEALKRKKVSVAEYTEPLKDENNIKSALHAI